MNIDTPESLPYIPISPPPSYPESRAWTGLFGPLIPDIGRLWLRLRAQGLEDPVIIAHIHHEAGEAPLPLEYAESRQAANDEWNMCGVSDGPMRGTLLGCGRTLGYPITVLCFRGDGQRIVDIAHPGLAVSTGVPAASGPTADLDPEMLIRHTTAEAAETWTRAKVQGVADPVIVAEVTPPGGGVAFRCEVRCLDDRVGLAEMIGRHFPEAATTIRAGGRDLSRPVTLVVTQPSSCTVQDIPSLPPLPPDEPAA